ncbi:unnamed protein product [Linum trigynum]|uniref:Tf2-1-like SH3-like domain-containing protein n=1 Tax=Linum trigynum TaxID=586398 RepID=A0AAV2E8Y0_9ROSI
MDKVKWIQENMKIAQDRQKSYADKPGEERTHLVGDKVFLKVSPWKGVMRFGKKGKLSPRYIGSYKVLERVGPLAYTLVLPPNLSKIHNVFHVSMLKGYRSDPIDIVRVEDIQLDSDMTYTKEPVGIIDRQDKELRRKKVPMVKVVWRN